MNVTVITVCFNAKEDLKKTLRSVWEQTYTNMEYLVIDGGSTDGTIEYLKEYKTLFEKKGKLFRYVSESDNGTYDAMNKGALIAQGKWINYMNAGDTFYCPDSLTLFFAHEIQANIGVVFGNTCQEYDFGIGIAKYEDYVKDNPIMPFCHQSCFVRTKLMQSYLFDTSYRIVADHDLFFRLHSAGVKYQYIDEVVARYNSQYGLSATHPLLLRKEGLRIHHIKEKWYYPLVLLWVYVRYGWVQSFKNNMPHWITEAWIKHKKKYITNLKK